MAGTSGVGMLHLYDDLSRTLRPFTTQNREVRLYVCGITPYDATHMGHAFTYCSFDILTRYLEWQGKAVRYVQNVTDVDDDILRRARERGEDWYALGNRWVRRFADDMEALNVRPPDVLPRASEAIPAMIPIIERLLSTNHAYARGGSVYYRASRAPFGCLSGLPPSEWAQIAAERGNLPQDPNKEAPLDFVLWQAQAPGEPAWLSPWGPGRPGWHIECSTLSALYLGPTIDIHGGGGDLSFPHHECEIAQAEASSEARPFARFWLHTGMVHYQGAKMSKSLGNLVMVQDLLRDYTANALRLYLASHHYRQAWSFAAEELEQAAERGRNWEAAAAGPATAIDAALTRATQHEFEAAMNNDLDTPRAVRALDRMAQALRSSPVAGGSDSRAQRLLRSHAGILGIRLGHAGPEERVIAGWVKHKTRFRVPESA